MSKPASSTSSASLQGVHLVAVQANLRALGHDVNEAQLVSMLRNIDISEVLGRSARGTRDSAAPHQEEPVASSASSVAAASDELQRRTDRSSISDVSLDGRTQKSGNGTAASTRASKQRSRRICSESYRSDVTADSYGELHSSVRQLLVAPWRPCNWVESNNHPLLLRTRHRVAAGGHPRFRRPGDP